MIDDIHEWVLLFVAITNIIMVIIAVVSIWMVRDFNRWKGLIGQFQEEFAKRHIDDTQFLQLLYRRQGILARMMRATEKRVSVKIDSMKCATPPATTPGAEP